MVLVSRSKCGYAQHGTSNPHVCPSLLSLGHAHKYRIEALMPQISLSSSFRLFHLSSQEHGRCELKRQQNLRAISRKKELHNVQRASIRNSSRYICHLYSLLQNRLPIQRATSYSPRYELFSALRVILRATSYSPRYSWQPALTLLKRSKR